MQKQNLDEYKFIRSELLNLKDCVTTYMGFVIGGSGAAFIGIAAVAKNSTSDLVVGAACILLSFVISIVLSILFYKFNSHNRFAGYCKLLNQEKMEIKRQSETTEQFLSWEICMDILRTSDKNPEVLINKCSKMEVSNISNEFIQEKIISLIGRTPQIDKYRFWKGLRIFCRGLIGKAAGDSWRFPTYVVSVFSFLNFMFLCVGFYFLRGFGFSNLPNISHDTEITLWALATVILVQLLMWIMYIKKLYSLMEGSATVDSYCWKFLPIRYSYITKQATSIKYELITLKDSN